MRSLVTSRMRREAKRSIEQVGFPRVGPNSKNRELTTGTGENGAHQSAADTSTSEIRCYIEAAETAGGRVEGIGIPIQASDSHERTPVPSNEERLAWLGKPVRAGLPFVRQALEERETFATAFLEQRPEIAWQLVRPRDDEPRKDHEKLLPPPPTGSAMSSKDREYSKERGVAAARLRWRSAEGSSSDPPLHIPRKRQPTSSLWRANAVPSFPSAEYASISCHPWSAKPSRKRLAASRPGGVSWKNPAITRPVRYVLSMGTLPKGQRAIDDFPRFGLQQFQYRFPEQTDRVAFEVRGDVEKPLLVEERFLQLPRTMLVSDLHCVTTWSKCGLEWSGVRFRDFYEQLVVPDVRPEADARLVVFRGQDGTCASLPLEDLLADDVLLADTLDGQPLSIAHGAPVRLVAPRHYGYKNIKPCGRSNSGATRATTATRRPGFSTIRERASITKRGQSVYRIGSYDRCTGSSFPQRAGSLVCSSNDTCGSAVAAQGAGERKVLPEDSREPARPGAPQEGSANGRYPW